MQFSSNFISCFSDLTYQSQNNINFWKEKGENKENAFLSLSQSHLNKLTCRKKNPTCKCYLKILRKGELLGYFD